MPTDETNTRVQTGNWRSWKLKWWCTGIILLWEIGVLVTIITLTVLSRQNNGWRHVPDTPLYTLAGHAINRQLLWTSLPTLVMVLLGLSYAMIVSSAADLQPYVELVDNKKQRRDARVTIMLDYATYPPLYNWIVAFRNRHPHLGCAMLVHFLCSFSLTPLTSSLFRPALTVNSTNVTTASVKEAKFLSLGTNTNLQPAIDLAGAIHTYSASSPLWMTPEYSFDPFVAFDNGGTGNVTAITSAYYVKPQCEIIDPTITGGVGENANIGSVSIQFEDRHCNVSGSGLQWGIDTSRQAYSYTWWQECSGSEDALDRVGVFAAIYSTSSPHNLANITVISCYPQYMMNVAANLTIASEDTTPSAFVSVQIDSATARRIRLPNFRDLHSTLPAYKQIGFSSTLNSDTFGNAVNAYAQTLSPGSEFQPEIYLPAMEKMYTTLFAGLTHLQLTRAREAQLNSYGTLTTATTKLYVLFPVAVTLAILLVFMITSTIVLIVYVELARNILTEEPIGLLGKAFLLLRSEVLEIATVLQDRHAPDQLFDQVKQNYTVSDSTCWYEGDSRDGTSRIMVEGLRQIDPDYEVRSWWRRLTDRLFGQKRDSTGNVEDQKLSEHLSTDGRTEVNTLPADAIDRQVPIETIPQISTGSLPKESIATNRRTEKQHLRRRNTN